MVGDDRMVSDQQSVGSILFFNSIFLMESEYIHIYILKKSYRPKRLSNPPVTQSNLGKMPQRGKNAQGKSKDIRGKTDDLNHPKAKMQ